MKSQILTLIGLILSLIGAILISVDAFGLADFLETLEYKEKDVNYDENEELYCYNQEKIAKRNMTQIFYIYFINTTCKYLLFNSIVTCILYFIFKLSFYYCLLLYFIWYPIWKLILFILEKIIQKFSNPPVKYKEGDGCLLCALTIILTPIWIVYYGIPFLMLNILKYGIDIIFYLLGEKVFAKWIISLLKYLYSKISYGSYNKFNINAYRGFILILIGFIYQVFGIVLSLSQH
jgi:hypothetical protein